MRPLVIDVPDPALKSQVKLLEGLSTKSFKELVPQGPEEPLDLSSSLGRVGS